MSNFLRQATASQSRMFGPFVDDTDFKTLKTGLTIANTDIKLSVNGGAGASKNSGGGTHRNNGDYSITLDATDTATVGELSATCLVSGALVVKKTWWVLEEAIYDALFAPSAAAFDSSMRVDVGKLLGSATDATNLGKAADSMFRGAVTGSTSTTTLIDSSLTQSANDHWKGRILIFTSGALQYQATDITAFDASLDKLTFSALTGSPSNGDTYIIL